MMEVQRELAMLLTVVLLLLPWLHQADTSVSTAHPFMHSGLCSEARSAWLLPLLRWEEFSAVKPCSVLV